LSIARIHLVVNLTCDPDKFITAEVMWWLCVDVTVGGNTWRHSGLVIRTGWCVKTVVRLQTAYGAQRWRRCNSSHRHDATTS